MTKRKRKGGRKTRTSQNVSIAPTPYNGDHGTGTQAANANTEIVPLQDDPNNRARRQKRNVLKGMLSLNLLTMRQWQAGEAIQIAHLRYEMLSSGGELKERVQSSPKPDATMDVQVDAVSRFIHVMAGVPRADRAIVEAVCCHNAPLRSITAPRRMQRLRASLDRVADYMEEK